jgi:hypothetical protein
MWLNGSTMTIWAWKWDENYNIKRFVINTGHGGYTGVTWKTYNGTVVGEQSRNGLYAPAATNCNLTSCDAVADAGRIPVDASSSDANALIWVDSNNANRTMYGGGLFWEGQPICKGGVGNWNEGGGYRCGEVTVHGTTYQMWLVQAYRWIFFTNADRADFDLGTPGNGDGESGSVGGDSGAPVFWQGTFLGVASTTSGHYSRAAKIEQALNVSICYEYSNHCP